MGAEYSSETFIFVIENATEHSVSDEVEKSLDAGREGGRGGG